VTSLMPVAGSTNRSAATAAYVATPQQQPDDVWVLRSRALCARLVRVAGAAVAVTRVLRVAARVGRLAALRAGALVHGRPPRGPRAGHARRPTQAGDQQGRQGNAEVGGSRHAHCLPLKYLLSEIRTLDTV